MIQCIVKTKKVIKPKGTLEKKLFLEVHKISSKAVPGKSRHVLPPFFLSTALCLNQKCISSISQPFFFYFNHGALKYNFQLSETPAENFTYIMWYVGMNTKLYTRISMAYLAYFTPWADTFYTILRCTIIFLVIILKSNQ